MKIIGHGVDLVSIQSIKSELEETTRNWVKQVYSDDERRQSDCPPVDIRYYASRFAGKEAVAQALGTGFAGDITWQGIEILRDDAGAPFVRLSDQVSELADKLGISEWNVSISYCGDIAMASVIASGPDVATE